MQQTQSSQSEQPFTATTDGITVNVQPIYLEEQSSPADSSWVWAYRIDIHNHSPNKVQLLNRHWKISDANGVLSEVKGPGVVGEQPVIQPGGKFNYSSFTQLRTATGFMFGTYEMVVKEPKGKAFSVKIPIFSLDSPGQSVVLN